MAFQIPGARPVSSEPEQVAPKPAAPEDFDPTSADAATRNRSAIPQFAPPDTGIPKQASRSGAGGDPVGGFNLPGARPVASPSPSTASPGQQVAAAAEGAASGALDVGPAIAGASAGFMLGGPPGMLLGGLGGALTGNLIRETFGTRRPEQFPEDQRAAAYMGEVLGGSFPIGGGVLAAGQAGVRVSRATRVQRMVDDILLSAAERPGRFAAAETSLATGAGIAAGLAENIAPGNEAARVGAEIAAGILNPVGRAIQGSSAVVDMGRRVASKFSRDATRTRAGMELKSIIDEFGEDTDALTKALRESDILAGNVTAGQLTGSPALKAIEADLIRKSGKFGREASDRAQKSLENMKRMIGALEESGNPEALTMAAEARKEYFDALLDMRIATATQDAKEAAAKITADTPEARRELSERAYELVNQGLKDMRQIESELWGEVAKEQRISASTVLSRRAAIEDEFDLYPEDVDEFLSPAVKRIFERIRGSEQIDPFGTPVDEGIRASQILRLRSRLLEGAREAAAQNKFTSASVQGALAEAALDDLEGIAGVTTAREFSRELHDRFTRTYAGTALARSNKGGLRQPPELLLRKAFVGGADARDIRLEELDAALRASADRALSPDQEAAAKAAVNEMMQIQERVLRLAASETVDPVTGVVSPRRLATFRQENAAAIERLGLGQSLEDARTAERILRDIQENATRGSKVIRQRAAFHRLAGGENSVEGVGRILNNSREPVRMIGQLTRLARSHGPEAVAGLRRAMFDETFEKAGGLGENFSFDRYRKLMFEPRRPGQPPVVTIMQDAGILSKAEADNLRNIVDTASRIDSALRSGTDPDAILSETPAMLDFMTRIAGARLATLDPMTTGGGGASLVVAGAGSKLARNIFDRVPNERVRDVIVEAALNPPMMAALLERAPDKARRIQLAKQINAFALQAGLIEPQRGEDTGADENTALPPGARTPQ